MTSAMLEGQRLTEQERIQLWRENQLLELGMTPTQAIARASQPFDLALLRALVAAGCALETAWRIVRED